MAHALLSTPLLSKANQSNHKTKVTTVKRHAIIGDAIIQLQNQVMLIIHTYCHIFWRMPQ